MRGSRETEKRGKAPQHEMERLILNSAPVEKRQFLKRFICLFLHNIFLYDKKILF